MVPTKRILTSLQLCGYMLYVKVYCTSGALCRICALARCWPVFANGTLLRMGRLDSPRLSSPRLASPLLSQCCRTRASFPSHVAERHSHSSRHPATEEVTAWHICEHNLRKEQSQKAGSEQLGMQELFSHLLVFLPPSAFNSGNLTVFAQ